VHLDLLRDRRFATGLLTAFLLTFANISFYLLITLYMQSQLGMTCCNPALPSSRSRSCSRWSREPPGHAPNGSAHLP
jgi:hypothetical protein